MRRCRAAALSGHKLTRSVVPRRLRPTRFATYDAIVMCRAAVEV